MTQQTMKASEADFSEGSQCELAVDGLKQAAQRELAAGVLKQAAQDLRRFHGATSKIERALYVDAYRWLTLNEYSSPFSFLNVCQLLNLGPDNVRYDLVGDSSLGALSYWARRCGRAAADFGLRLATSLSTSGTAMLNQETWSSTTRPLQSEHFYMKTLTDIRPRSYSRKRCAVSRNPKLDSQWQHGIETIAGHVQWKLHLTLAHSPSSALPTVNR